VHRYDLISCRECGVLHQRCTLLSSEKACCVRCHAILYRGKDADLNRMSAIILAAIFTFLIAQCCPIVQLSVSGNTSSVTLTGAIRVLWVEQMHIVALIVLLFIVLLPALELVALLYVTLSLLKGFRPRSFDHLLRAVGFARRWGMTEVLMIGILITIVKISSLAQIEVQAGLFAFGVLTFMLAIVKTFDQQMLWNFGEHLPGHHRPAQAYFHYTASMPLISCHSCGLVAQKQSGAQQDCARCGVTIHQRFPDSVNRTWAFLIAAIILYIPANLLPVMYTNSLFGKEDDTIISGVVYFWNSGSPALATIIFIASILVPVMKLAALSLLAWTAQRRSSWHPMQRTKLYRIVEFVGRWSMLDIFVITLTVALVRFQSLAVITAGPGAMAFCAVVVLTMLASMQFDPRLIWDPVNLNGENYA